MVHGKRRRRKRKPRETIGGSNEGKGIKIVAKKGGEGNSGRFERESKSKQRMEKIVVLSPLATFAVGKGFSSITISSSVGDDKGLSGRLRGHHAFAGWRETD